MDDEINTLSDYLIEMFTQIGCSPDDIDDRMAEIAHHLKTAHLERMDSKSLSSRTDAKQHSF